VERKKLEKFDDAGNAEKKCAAEYLIKGEFFGNQKEKVVVTSAGNTAGWKRCMCMYVHWGWGEGLSLMKTDSPRCFGGISY
jgi:hypothetical protein